MVYCGKASQGCQSCRTRRIKCDRAQPQCTQCIRVRKPCPGYRDQLSLMFRDESTKVMQRAHAQWGLPDSSDLGEPSSSSTSPSSQSSMSDHVATPPASLAPRVRKAVKRNIFPKEVCATPVDKAIQFYIEHYVIGLPDEPRIGQDLRGTKWIHSRETRDIMAAVGMAGLSNLTGDKEMSTLAKHHYGLALQNVSSSIRNPSRLELDIVMRAVVMMAMYEVVRGRDDPASPARTHIMGGAAIVSNFLPRNKSPVEELRGLMQLCFSMLASIQGSLQSSSPEPNVLIPQRPQNSPEGGLPRPFFDWISMGSMIPDPDKPSAELIGIIVGFVQLSTLVRSQPLVDGYSNTSSIVRQALDIDAQLDSWESHRQGLWAVTEKNVPNFFPPQAALDDCYHVYSDMYIARVWNHYRWARILVNQLLLEAAERFPRSSTPLISTKQKQLSLDRIRRLTRDTLVSVPSHYRHPKLGVEQCDCLDETRGGAVIGIAGIPTLLFEVKVAGCAPGVPRRHRTWALGILDTVWADMGMWQAKVLAGFLRRVVEREKEGEEDRVLVAKVGEAG